MADGMPEGGDIPGDGLCLCAPEDARLESQRRSMLLSKKAERETASIW